MLINHFHVMRPGAKDKSNPERGTIDQIRSIMDQLQMDRAVLFAPFLHDFKPEKVDYRYCNNWLVDLIKGDPRFVGFITLKPTEPDAPELLTEFADNGAGWYQVPSSGCGGCDRRSMPRELLRDRRTLGIADSRAHRSPRLVPRKISADSSRQGCSGFSKPEYYH